MEKVYIVKLEKTIINNLISYTKVQPIGELSCLFVTGLDHCTADTGH
jgi:hypothetical protein